MATGEGEKLHAARRRRFWLLIGGLALIGFVGGLVGGYVMAHDEASGGTGASGAATWLAAGGIVLVAILAAVGSWRFFVSVDEVELADNLWGSLIGFYTYVILFPAWWALWKLGRVPEPDDWAILATSIVIGLAAYLYRKWRFSQGN